MPKFIQQMVISQGIEEKQNYFVKERDHFQEMFFERTLFTRIAGQIKDIGDGNFPQQNWKLGDKFLESN